MIELIYFILKNIFNEIEPYDVVHRSKDQLYLQNYDLIISFCPETTKIYQSKNVVIIHEKDEAPNLAYLNHYPSEISYKEAFRIVTSIFDDFMIDADVILTPISYEEAKDIYERSVLYHNDCYVKRIMDILSESDELFYPPEEDNLRDWFEMQPQYYSIEYPCNGKKVLVLNDSAYGNWGYYYSAMSKYLAIKGKDKIMNNECWNDIRLGAWQSNQRTAIQEGNKLIWRERIKFLERINFKLNVYDDAFERNMALLEDYKNEKGHCNPEKREAYKSFNIGRFCLSMRQDYRDGTISEDRKARLDALGFDWDPLETEWNRRLEQYKRYIEENGGKPYIARRTIFEGEKLGAWVETQRKWYNLGKMSEARYKALKVIAPNFEVSGA